MFQEAIASIVFAAADPVPPGPGQPDALWGGLYASVGAAVAGAATTLVYLMKARYRIKKDDRHDVLDQYRRLVATQEKRIATLERKVDKSITQFQKLNEEAQEAKAAQQEAIAAHADCIEDNKKIKRRMDRYEKVLREASLWPVAFDSDKDLGG